MTAKSVRFVSLKDKKPISHVMRFNTVLALQSLGR